MYEKMALVVSDLGKLLSEYSKHQVDWYDIGLQLGIDKHALDVIKHDYQNKAGGCFREMLAYWLENNQSATKSRLQRAIEDAKNLTNSLSPSHNKWLKVPGHYLIAIIRPIILGMIVFMYYQHYSNCPLITAAEILKTEYRAQKVTKFNLPISGNSDLEYLGILMKGGGHEFGHSELAQNYSGESGRLIVIGLPGSGKTTLLRHLAKEWASGRVLKYCQILFLISLGSLEGEVNTLGDLLSKSGFGDLVNLKDISEKIYAINGAGACFLFDAYDELKGKRYKFIDAIIQGSKIHSSFCLLTSRPFFSETFKKITQVEILGYDIDNLTDYLQRLSDNTTLVSAIQHSWDNNPKVKEMCTLPLNMAMMLYIYSYESSVSFRTTTQLYIAFMNVTIKHYEGHRHEWNTESLWQCIRANAPHGDDLCSAFNILHQVAYDTVSKHQDLFPDIKATKDDINQLSFVGVTSVPGSKSRVKFTFSHPTFLEFFAALHLTTLPLNEQLAFITAYQNHGKESYNMRILNHHDYTSSHVIYVEFYLGLIGDKFHYNTSGATPFLKQLFIKSGVDYGVCIVYKWVEEVIGWTTQQYTNAIKSIFKANYSVCAYHTFNEKFYSDHLLSSLDADKLGLAIEVKSSIFGDDSFIMVTLNLVDYHNVYLTRQEQAYLWLCIQGLRDNKDSDCHGLRLPSVTSLTIAYYPHKADTFHKMKSVLPNLEYIDIRLLINNWNQFSSVMESLSKTLKLIEIELVLQLNLKINIHLDIDIDRCSIEGTRISPYIDELNHVSLHHITLTGACHDNNFTQYLCKSVLEYSTHIEDAAHAQSLIACIQQAQSLKTLNLVYYYEGAKDTIKQKKIFRNLPQTLQMLNVCGFYRTESKFFWVSSKLDIKLLVDALIDRKNLRRLTVSIANVEDMKILTQLTFLTHLHIILDNSLGLWDDDDVYGSVDKSTILPIASHLQHFPHLESFALTVGDYSCHLSDYDKQMILSTIFDISPARDVQICLSRFSAQDLPQFDKIFSGHLFTISDHRTHLHRQCHMYAHVKRNRFIWKTADRHIYLDGMVRDSSTTYAQCLNDYND